MLYDAEKLGEKPSYTRAHRNATLVKKETTQVFIQTGYGGNLCFKALKTRKTGNLFANFMKSSPRVAKLQSCQSIKW